jgi:hypothetical protein
MLTKFSGLFLFLFSLMFLEGLLWFVNYPGWMQPKAAVSQPVFHEPDSLIGWRNRPGGYHLAIGNRLIEVNIWPDSSRATRPSPTPEGPKLLLVTGCSFAMGYGLSDSDTVAWRIQQGLPDLDVRNLGTAGYGTYQALLSLRAYLNRQPGHQPRAFLYLFNEFHEPRNVGAINWQTQLSVPPESSGFHFPFAELDGNDHLVALKSRGLIPWQPAQHSRLLAFLNESYWFMGSLGRLSHKKRVTEAILQEMNQTAVSRGAHLYVVFLRFDHERQRDYQSLFEKWGIRFVDCNVPEQYQPAFQLEDGHPNAAMNARTADCILQSISATSL